MRKKYWRTERTMESKKMPIMAHLVLGYPTLAESLRTAARYVAAGVEILELQIPFSHPTADGPVITRACQEATRQGVSMADCIEAIAGLRRQHPRQEIMIMSYLNRVYAYGFGAFTKKMSELNIQHVIIPDLPVDEADGLLPTDCTVRLVPVLAANASTERLEKLLDMRHDFYYLMSDFKITGSGFSLHPNLAAIVQRIRDKDPRNRVGVGFGIATREQVQAVLDVADVAIIGSSLIQAQEQGHLEEYLASIA
jgi:tryptophan synthase alpha chain